LAALRFYHLQFNVKADVFSYSLTADEATPNYHVALSIPPSPPAELYFVNGHYISNLPGAPFVDSGSEPPSQAAGLEAAEQFTQSWFDHPDSAAFKGAEPINGVQANHYGLTWKAGRQATLGGISATTYDPAVGDVWLDSASGALIKSIFSMRVNAAGGQAQVTGSMDVTNINQPITVTPPPAQKAATHA